MARILSIGECMIELTRLADDTCRFGYGGDSLNTAVYLARLGVDVDYLTAVGDDSPSDWLLAQWQDEGVGVDRVVRLAGRAPGLYLVETHSTGERQFSYWRDTSAARDLLTGLPDPALGRILADYDVVYLTGVSLAILSADDRAKVVAALADARNLGRQIVFDTNFRAALWPDVQTAVSSFEKALAVSSLVFASDEDLGELWPDSDDTKLFVRLHEMGVEEVALKRSERGATVSFADRHVDVPAQAVTAVDTTAAGDSFNAAYLAARLAGDLPKAAAQQGCTLAAYVVQHPGAIAPRQNELKLVRGCR